MRHRFSDVAMTPLVAIFLFLFTPTFSLSALRTGTTNKDKDDEIYYVTKMSDRFLEFMTKHQDAVDKFSAAEMDRLKSAILNAGNAHDKSLLETTAMVNEESRLEAQNAFGEMRNLANTLKQAMGAIGSTSRCQDLTCGSHAYCTVDRTLGARCLCKDGYEGNGFICKTPLQFTSHALMQLQPGRQSLRVADIHVSTLNKDTIVAAYRDITNANRGYALVGHASPDIMRWHEPVLFSNTSQAFDPVIVHLQEDNGLQGGIAIAFRDADRGGDGILLGGRIDPLNGQVTFGEPRAFAHHQAQAMAMLPLQGSRVAVVFAEHILDDKAGKLRGGAMYGATLLAQVHSDGKKPEVINKDRFASGPVARLSATALSPTLFAIAYRRGQVESGAPLAEASCIAGQVRLNHIIFNSPAVLLEPEQTNIWSRSLSRIGSNLLAYTYHSGNEQVTKQAIIRANDKTHHLEVVHGPEVVAHGFTPAVGSVSLEPSSEEAPSQKTGSISLSQTEQHRHRSARLLSYVGHDGAKPASARLCVISKDGVPSGCKEFSWAGRDLTSGSGAPLSDGRFLFLFTDARGNPYYQFIGLADPLI